jgi:hypothetical protein
MKWELGHRAVVGTLLVGLMLWPLFLLSPAGGAVVLVLCAIITVRGSQGSGEPSVPQSSHPVAVTQGPSPLVPSRTWLDQGLPGS